MYERYQIETAPAKLPSTRIGKFAIIRGENCLNCGRCMTFCIYDVHKRDPVDPRKMSEPASYLCKNCFSCIQNCPQQALKMVRNREYENLGNAYWTPDVIHTLWNEAEEGKIPIYGAGFRGPFKGPGFDRIWTDLSEIVRPTRDGIHGREYIATAVDLGRKLSWIRDLQKLDLPHFQEIQIPMLLDTRALGIKSKNILMAIVQAAHRLGTFAFIDLENYGDDLEPYLESIALRIPFESAAGMDRTPWSETNFLEFVLPKECSIPALERILEELKSQNPGTLISLGLKAPFLSGEIFRQFPDGRADILNFYADSRGNSLEGSIFISEAIKSLHLDFVKECFRDEITILGRGGIAAAEHVPKLIICGADAAVLDLALLVAMGCQVCQECHLESCPAGIHNLDAELASQRIINMISAWRDQLLEVLSAMGIRDVRRLRGEVGRAMFYEEIEKESFAFIFNDMVGK